jgi:hypothetical protein
MLDPLVAEFIGAIFPDHLSHPQQDPITLISGQPFQQQVNKLTQELAAQQQVVLQEKQQLEESVQQIVAVHMQVANGNLNVRVPLDQKNVLWPLAGSLNNLLARFQRWRQEASQLQYVERSIQQTLHDIQQAKTQGTPLTYRKTGTMLDPLVAEFIGAISPDHLSHPQQDQMTLMPDQQRNRGSSRIIDV